MPIILDEAFAYYDEARLTKMPGIGKKTGARMILELRDKMKKIELEDVAGEEVQTAIVVDDNVQEAISALQVLGYSRKEIEKALEKVEKETLTVEDMIRKALNNLAR